MKSLEIIFFHPMSLQWDRNKHEQMIVGGKAIHGPDEQNRIQVKCEK